MLKYTTDQLIKIFLSCGVHWVVSDENSMVPGTNISWDELIQEAVIFPYIDKCYVIPFWLIWNPKVSSDSLLAIEDKKSDIKKQCRLMIKGFDIENLFLTYDMLCKFDIYHLGIQYEILFASSLAVKYFLRLLVQPLTKYLKFQAIYDLTRTR